MLKFISLGSGSSGNCYFLQTASDGIIIDAGIGVRTLKKHAKDYGLNLSMIHHVVVTHDHADHIKSVGSISYEFNLPVYATEKVHNGIDKNYCVQRKVRQEMRHYLQYGVAIEVGDFKVTPFLVPHDASDNVGFFIEADGVTFCIITDAGCVTEDMAQYIQRADYLVIEANHDEEMLLQGPYPDYLKKRIMSNSGHLSNKSCGEAIANHMNENLKHVWLCHLSEENNHPELARKTVDSVLRSYGIIVGKDLEMDVLKRKLPTGFFDLHS